MNVFISWSGDESKELAEVIRNWLPNVIPALQPFYSPVDIKAGIRWSSEIEDRLKTTKIGITCLTRENLYAPWLMFEAGAISNKLDSRVCSILFGMKSTDVQGPLTQFQMKVFGQDGIRDVLVSINDLLKPDCLPVETLIESFNKWWLILDIDIKKVLSKYNTVGIKSTRTEKDLIEEILIRIRNSTVASPINTDMVKILIECYKLLSDSMRYIRNDEKRQEAVRALWTLQFPIQHLITRIEDTSSRREMARAYADAASIFFQSSGDVDKDKLVGNLVNPSHGLIITAPVIPKPKQQQ
ncbi:MAG: toll/interleukin-1 receptor domain-containing protein [Sedimentisphaerales bacterium]|nr:toll/interleukin-1 receptor domain-containing protein [Sedimentisphaerales bacterium]